MHPLRTRITYLLVAFLCSFSAVYGQIQCANDVVIQEGTQISMCSNNLLTISGNNGFSAYAWSGPEVQTGQTITPGFSGQYILAATDGVGCISQDTIDVIINTAPTVSILSSEGNPLCTTSSGTILSTSNTYSSYSWSTGATSSTIFVNSAQTYSVDVVDANTCTGTATMTLTSYSFDVTTTNNGVCSGGASTVTASGGGAYLWSNGETGSSIVVDVETATTYWVEISSGTCIDTLYTVVLPGEEFNYSLPDTVYMSLGDIEILNGPLGFTDYLWTPGANIDNPIAMNAVYHGNYSEMVYLEANYQGLCTYTDSVYMLVINLTVPGGFSPNGDNKNQTFRIPELEYLDGSIQIWNRWGDLVFKSDHYENNWNGTCQTGLCLGGKNLPEGTYFYEIVVGDEYTRGHVTLKR